MLFFRRFRVSSIFLCGLCLAAPFSACGADESRAASDLDELILLQGYEAQIRDSQEVCMRSVKDLNMENRFKLDPLSFGGIAPSDRKWEKAKHIYADYLTSLCLEPTAETQIRTIKKTLEEQLNPKEVRDAVAFSKSPLGRTLLSAMTEVNRRLASLQNSDLSPAFMAAYDRYQRELAALQKTP